MKIAQIAPAIEAVPPPKYGGTELVVSSITEELTRRGHDVHLFATADSITKAHLHPVFPHSIRAHYSKDKYPLLRDAAMHSAMGPILEGLEQGNYDIVHNHLGWRLLPFLHLIKTPTVTTLHGTLDDPFAQEMFSHYKEENYVSISQAQRRPLPDLHYTGTVYNGIAVSTFPYQEKPGNYLAFLGRISPSKGPVEAIQVAKKAGLPLIMAAKVDPKDQAFYEQEVKPLIDGKQIRFIGEVDHAGKVRLLKNALALLALVQWEEPFGLFMVEAMACGTPVIATNRGSVAEVIKDKETGFIVANTPISAVNALGKITTLSRAACRTWVERQFSTQTMVDGYETVYKKMHSPLPSFTMHPTFVTV